MMADCSIVLTGVMPCCIRQDLYRCAAPIQILSCTQPIPQPPSASENRVGLGFLMGDNQ